MEQQNNLKLQIKPELPLVPLRDIVVFPKVNMPLVLKDSISIKAVDVALRGDRMALFVAMKNAEFETIRPEDLYKVGTIARIRDITRQPDGMVRVFIEGLIRSEIKSFVQTSPYLSVIHEVIPFPKFERTEKIDAQMYSFLNYFKECVNLGANVPFDVLLLISSITDPWQLVDVVILNLNFKTEERQIILEARTIEEKLEKGNIIISRLLKVLRMARKIQSETGKELGKMEREMFLREQLKTIQKELGEGGVDEIEELRKKIEKAGMPEEAKKQALKELSRLEGMPSFSPEISYIRNYLDWLISLPWSKKSETVIDIKKAEKILDEDHYGLEKVKKRVLEFLAVQKLVGKIKGPILCFVGPPGTGKTSIGKSIARATGRKFFRMSLGGIRDEAEIRGHRRTYVGALPGRIIQGIKTAGTRNPVFMLDEIDKLGYDVLHGDPSAALLEALDPEQNYSFSDHYLEVPFDLSDVMFITTANILDTIPPALRDRMEVIEFPGYTEEEKFHIAKDFLIPKEFENNGIKPSYLKITDEALRKIISEYTREAGVRNLGREIASICRKVARDFAEDGKKTIVVGPDDLKKYLGPTRFKKMEAEKKNEIGVVAGLAWTQVGGEILLIEATQMPGKGRLILTGHLGKVMQESAQAAFSYARSQTKKLGIKTDITKNTDFHVHVPSGAIPKDGPSAGIAMAVALISVMSHKLVRRDVAMTGEITLRGKVMEIGGVKEKVLAAHRAGIKTVILPKDNEKDMEEIPPEVKKSLKFVFVKTMDEVLKYALVGK
jgi:ATP-dependent Lon protease